MNVFSVELKSAENSFRLWFTLGNNEIDFSSTLKWMYEFENILTAGEELMFD